ncbi:MAG: glucosaminidase domain-containing protein [Anaerorhabdus sp.]
MLKKISKLFIMFVVVLLSFDITSANLNDDLLDSDKYTVVAIEDKELLNLKAYSSFKSAKNFYLSNVEDYDNLLIVKSKKVLQAKHGIVKINSSSACDVNVEFINDLDEGPNYTNGCYGADAAYLDTNSSGKRVKFKISGAVGWANIDDMSIVPVEFIESRLSTYIVNDGYLYHQIKSSFESDLYAAIINLGPAPKYLGEDEEFYSYDGHYFYDSSQLRDMLDDYKESTYINSINKNDAYYNYYQYISHRSVTNVTVEDVKKYFTDELYLSSAINTYSDLDKDSANDVFTQSQFYNQEESFFQYQYQYGSNALMMLALSTNETAFGRSSLSYTRNNLFGHAAYDSDVEKNASRYFSVASSIYSHAKYYISGSYSNPLRFQFHGGFFGNKSSGMNVSYASDPYWGEKAAQYYFKIDEIFDFKDFNSNSIGIKNSSSSVKVYANPSDEASVLYETGKMEGFSFVLLDKISNSYGNWYKVQSEATLDNNSVDISYFYDFENYVGYIHQDDIQIVLNEDKIADNSWKEVVFDADGGIFIDGSEKISYKMQSDKTPIVETPTKNGYLFSGWSQKIKNDNDDNYYLAKYDKVKSIEILEYPKQNYEYNERIDLSGGKIKVELEDSKSFTTDITTSMISGYNLKDESDQSVTIKYAGMEVSYPITVSKELDLMRQNIQNEIIEIIDELGNLETLNDEQKERVLNLKKKMDDNMIPYLNQAQLRVLDSLIYKVLDKKINYVLYENEMDLSISGLSLSIPLGNSLENKFINDTYKVDTKNSIGRSAKKMINNVAMGSGYSTHNSFSISIKKNLRGIEINNPMVVSVKKPEDSSLNQLFTVLMYKDGEVIKCYTKQTDNYIQFMIPTSGEFMVVSRDTTNTYVIDDVVEVVRVDNRDLDIPLIGSIFLIILIFVICTIFFLDRRWRLFKRRGVKKKQIEEEAQIEAAVIKQEVEDGKTSKDNS